MCIRDSRRGASIAGILQAGMVPGDAVGHDEAQGSVLPVVYLGPRGGMIHPGPVRQDAPLGGRGRLAQIMAQAQSIAPGRCAGKKRRRKRPRRLGCMA